MCCIIACYVPQFMCCSLCICMCFFFRKWLPEIPQAADWSTPWLIGELTPPPRQDTAVSNYPFLQKLYKSQCSAQEREICWEVIAEILLEVDFDGSSLLVAVGMFSEFVAQIELIWCPLFLCLRNDLFSCFICSQGGRGRHLGSA
jgi:hypothetical protein